MTLYLIIWFLQYFNHFQIQIVVKYMHQVSYWPYWPFTFLKLKANLITLTHFRPILLFYTAFSLFLLFSGGKEKEHWPEMGLVDLAYKFFNSFIHVEKQPNRLTRQFSLPRGTCSVFQCMGDRKIAGLWFARVGQNPGWNFVYENCNLPLSLWMFLKHNFDVLCFQNIIFLLKQNYSRDGLKTSFHTCIY